jgi:hypothetical protein
MGFISVLVGLVMVILSKPLSRVAIESQNKFWGFNYGEEEIAVSRIVILIVGAGFIVVGLLAVFHIIRFK